MFDFIVLTLVVSGVLALRRYCCFFYYLDCLIVLAMFPRALLVTVVFVTKNKAGSGLVIDLPSRARPLIVQNSTNKRRRNDKLRNGSTFHVDMPSDLPH